MTDFSMKETDKKGEVIMGGELTVSNAGSIRDRLLELLKQSDDISVTVEEGAEADTAFFQILCSANLSASVSGKRFRLDGIPEMLFRAAGNGGFTGRPGCRCEQKCLWNRGGEKG